MNNTHETPLTISEPKRRGRFADFFIRLWQEKPLGTACGILILILIVVALFSEGLAPYPYREIHLADIMQTPSAQYLLGTDHLGRDLLSRLLYGARISIMVGLAATALNVIVAVLIGGTSGFLGGKVGPGCATFCRCLDGFSGAALVVNHHVHRGTGSSPDHRGAGDRRRYRRFPSHPQRRDWCQRE